MAAQTKRYKTKDKDNSELQEDAVIVIVFGKNQIQANPQKETYKSHPQQDAVFVIVLSLSLRQDKGYLTMSHKRLLAQLQKSGYILDQDS